MLPLCVIAALSGPLQAQAATCAVTASGVAFGAYAPTTGAPLSSSGTVTINCTGLLGLVGALISWSIALSPGQSASFSPRTMSYGSSALHYQLFTDASHTTVWGDGTNGTVTLNGSTMVTLGTITQSYVVYGGAPASQVVSPGAYSDTITITATFSGI